jgi:hypothetical protein
MRYKNKGYFKTLSESKFNNYYGKWICYKPSLKRIQFEHTNPNPNKNIDLICRLKLYWRVSPDHYWQLPQRNRICKRRKFCPIWSFQMFSPHSIVLLWQSLPFGDSNKERKNNNKNIQSLKFVTKKDFLRMLLLNQSLKTIAFLDCLL